MQKLLPLILPLLMFASCASAGIHEVIEEQPMRVSYTNGRQVFELANPAHTDPVQLYSTSRSKMTGMKVTKDAVMTDVIGFLASNNFAQYETPGKVLGSSLIAYSIAFEVETQAGISHWGISRQSTKDEIDSMRACSEHFFNIWNHVEAFQAVNNEKGDFKFKQN